MEKRLFNYVTWVFTSMTLLYEAQLEKIQERNSKKDKATQTHMLDIPKYCRFVLVHGYLIEECRILKGQVVHR